MQMLLIVDYLRKHIGWETSMRGIISRFSWIDKIHERTINLKNKDDKCFQYAATVALNHRQIKRNPDRVSNIEPFINKN